MRTLFAAALTVLALPACGSTALYLLNGNSANGRPFSVGATFDLNSLGALTLTVRNFTASTNDVTQVITGFVFSLHGLSDTAGISNSSGKLIQVSSRSTVDKGVQALTGWSATTTLQTISLSDLNQGQPVQGIIGAPEADGRYSQANGSIVKSSSHNPFVDQVATFTFNNLPGISGSSDISELVSDVEFGFGTAGTNYMTADLVAVKEPESTVLVAGGLVGFVLIRRRRINSARQRS